MVRVSIVLLFSFALISSCAERTRTEQATGQTQLETPTLIPLVDSGCDEGLDQFDGMTYHFWNGSFTMEEGFSRWWTSLNGIVSGIVKKIFYGYQEIYQVKSQCHHLDSAVELLTPQCLSGSQVTSFPQPVKICERRRYPRPSIEAAALSVAGAFDTIESFLASLSMSFEFQKVSVLLLPDIRFNKPGKEEKLSLTDNASWVLSQRFPDMPTYIALYPPSERYQESGRAPFYEVPWIVAHEFGHHLFYSFMSQEARHRFGYLSQLRNDLSLHDRWLVNQAPASYEEQHVLTGLNEAFADLLAHYVYDNDSRQITSLSCLFTQRDAASATFNDGQAKSFMYRPSQWKSGACSSVNLDDVHTTGAVVSYFLDQFLDLYHIKTARNKGRVLLDFYKTFLGEMEASVSEPLMQHFVRRLSAYSEVYLGEMSYDHCQLVDKIFGSKFTSPQEMISTISSCSDFHLEGSLANDALDNVAPVPF